MPYPNSHRNQNARDSGPSASSGKPIPYRFEPVHAEDAVLDAPLWRDGGSKEERYSGELLITLESLTPLIVGNQQQRIDEKHSLLVPQMLPDGRVLIGGAGLKGMLRATFASLLQAPMERVAEHHYTYRPNLGFAKGTPLCECRAAIVRSVEGSGADTAITIKLLPQGASVVFVRDKAWCCLGNPVAGEHIKKEIKDVRLKGKPHRQRLESARGERVNLDHIVLSYRGGIDGKGYLARAFNKDGGIYCHVLVARADVENKEGAKSDKLPGEIIQAYEQTQKILADDRIGHLGPGHPLAGKLGEHDKRDTVQAIAQNTQLEPNQLVYIEVEYEETVGNTQKLPKPRRFISLGHHFQYRWAYTSSVRRINRLLDGEGQLRPELALRPEERAGADGAPQALSAARLLFGYTVSDRDEERNTLAKDSYTRLAGRVACNTAVEVVENKSLAERFIDEGREVQLRILGMPRPSAVEFYLRQTQLPRLLTTYGDDLKDSGGSLSGRKFYRHQPDARKDESRNSYAPDRQERTADTNTAERGPCVRYLSSPGSRFRCTLRFDSLRPWELGALLAVLEPQKLAETFGLSAHPSGYAHKLGYGKPLGLGSVRMQIDKARWRQGEDWQWQCADSAETLARWQDHALNALKTKLLDTWGPDKAQQYLQAWLRPRQWQSEGSAAYPTQDGTIFNYHTTLRRDHAKARRSKGSIKGSIKESIMKFMDLEQQLKVNDQ